jgi:predicted Zn-ribbon and HTH transcriptional regulator
MIDLLVGIFGDMVLEKAREGIGPVSPLPRTLAGGVSDGVRLKVLERDHERLKLVAMAMWEVLNDKLGVSEAELRARIEALDELDGRKDGRLRMQPAARRCEACDRPMLGTAVACPYCGERPAETPLFP